MSNCETISILSGTGNDTVIVALDGVILTPSPFVSITQEKYTNGTQVIGGVWKINLNGTIIKTNFNDTTARVIELLNSFAPSDCITVQISKCGVTVPQNGTPLPADSLIYGYGRILNISFDQGSQPTWVNIVPYSIQIELYTNRDIINAGTQLPVVFPSTSVVPRTIKAGGSAYNLLSSYDESFSISTNEDAFNWDEVPGASPSPSSDITRVGNQHISVSFKISATGISGNNCGSVAGQPSMPIANLSFGLDAAERAIADKIDKLRSLDIDNLTELLDTPTDLSGPFLMYRNNTKLMEFRNININSVQNSIDVDGELIIRPSGCSNPNLFTNMTVEENVTGEGRTITISGNVKAIIDTGFENSELIKFGKFNCNAATISTTTLTKRMELINNFLNSLSYDTARLQNIANNIAHKRSSTETYLSDTCSYSLNNDPCACGSPIPSPLLCEMRLISSQLGRNYGEGTGSFSFTLTNEPNCTILGARKVDIDITHEKPVDNIVEIIVPGRGDKGVLIQNICCKTSEKYSIRVNATLNSNLCGFSNSTFDSTSTNFQACINSLLSNLEQKAGVDARCWFLVENSESFGNTSYSLNRQYVKPSCP